jgi:hypothetical protein
MTETPREQHDLPAEEAVDPADAADRLAQDPDAVPNAPNRDKEDAPDADQSPNEAGSGRHRSRDVDPPGHRDDPIPPDPPH